MYKPRLRHMSESWNEVLSYKAHLVHNTWLSQPLLEENPPMASKNKEKKKKKGRSSRPMSPRKEQYSHLLDETVGCGDMVLLDPLNEGNMIENLKRRYSGGEIYVSSLNHLCSTKAKTQLRVGTETVQMRPHVAITTQILLATETATHHSDTIWHHGLP